MEANGNENDDIVPLDMQISSDCTVVRLIYNKNDADLVSAVKSFKTRKGEAERVRKRVLEISAAQQKDKRSLKMCLNASYQAVMDTRGTIAVPGQIKGRLRS